MYITSSMIFRRSSNNFLFILFLNFFVLFFQAAAVGICYAGDLGDYEKKAQANTSNDFVKVRFNKKIEGIEVSAFWKPSPIFYGNCVLGPAIFLLRDTESNKVLSISANHVSFLTLGELDELGIDSNSLVDDSVLVSEFARVLNSQLDLFFNEDNRAKTQICENGKSCLKFGSSVVDFQDVNLDGRMDFLVKQCGIGQRGYSRIRVFEITEDFELGDPLYSFANSEPFSIFDSSSTIYPDERNIEVMLTSGACDSNFKYYHLGDEEEAVKLVRIVAVSSHEGCEPLEYEVVPHEFIYDGYVYHKNSK